MRALRIELRRGEVAWATPLFIFAGALAAFRFLRRGDEGWVNVSSAVVAGVQLVGPIAAGAAAWAAGRERRRGTEYLSQLADRSPVAAPLVELVAATFWPTLAYAVICAAVYAEGLLTHAWGTPAALWVLVGAAGLVVHAVFGYIVGRMLPYRFVPPLVSIGGFVYVAWNLVQSGHWWYFLSPVTVQEVTVFLGINNNLLLGQLSWYVGITLLVLAAWVISAGERRRTAVIGFAAGLLLVGAGVATVAQQHHRFFARALSPVRYLCDEASSSGPIVCVHPAFARGIGSLTTEFASLQRRLSGTTVRLGRLEQRLAGTGPATAGSLPFSIDRLQGNYESVAAEEVLTALLGYADTCPDNAEKAAADTYRYVGLVKAWLLDNSRLFVPISPEDRRALEWFARLPEHARKQWLQRNLSVIRACQLRGADFA